MKKYFTDDLLGFLADSTDENKDESEPATKVVVKKNRSKKPKSTHQIY
jgi:hypothetical protein